MTFANDLDPDEYPQNVEPHLISKLFDTQDCISVNIGMETMIFASSERNKITWDANILKIDHRRWLSSRLW